MGHMVAGKKKRDNKKMKIGKLPKIPAVKTNCKISSIGTVARNE